MMKTALPGCCGVRCGIDDLSGIAASVVTVNYDSTVLVCLGVDAGATSKLRSLTRSEQ